MGKEEGEGRLHIGVQRVGEWYQGRTEEERACNSHSSAGNRCIFSQELDKSIKFDTLIQSHMTNKSGYRHL